MDDIDPRAWVGSLVGERYQLTELIARETFGALFRATDTQDGGPLRLRLCFCPGDVPDEMARVISERFIRAARLMAFLSEREAAVLRTRVGHDPHPLPQGGEALYAVYEWVDGATLDVRRGEAGDEPPRRRCLAEAAQRFSGVMSALVYAHDHGFAHRRLRPSELWIEGEIEAAELKIKLTGFSGVSEPGGDTENLAEPPVEPPSPHYAAPEQRAGDAGRCGAWSDVYSMAMLLLDDMLGGTPAWEAWGKQERSGGEAFAEAGLAICPRRLGIDVSDDEERLLRCALHPDPDQRFRSMREFDTAIEQTLAGDPHSWTRRAYSACAKVVGCFEYESTFPVPNSRVSVARPPHKQRMPPRPENIVYVAPVGPPAGVVARNRGVVGGKQWWRLAAVGTSVAAIGALVWFVLGGDAVDRSRIGARTELGGELDPGWLADGPSRSGSPSRRIARDRTRAPHRSPSHRDASLAVDAAAAPLACPPEMVRIAARDGGDTGVLASLFCVQRRAVTVSQYRACTDAGSCDPPAQGSARPADAEDKGGGQGVDGVLCRWADEGRGAYPVDCVMGSQAAAYCEFRGWRLPTEAEWPHALTVSHDLFDRTENGFEWVAGSDPRHAELRPIRVEASAQLGARAPRVAAALLGPGRSYASGLGFRCVQALGPVEK
ncbi:MAG: SUMF1/EgtB/PvdO family nonheme iron enzyme [Nannocystaceae bacterium]